MDEEKRKTRSTARLKPVIVSIERLAAVTSPAEAASADPGGKIVGAEGVGPAACGTSTVGPATTSVGPDNSAPASTHVDASDEDRDTDAMSVTSVTSSLTGRKRGRPPTTGEYMNYAAAKRAAVEAERNALVFRHYRDRFQDSSSERRAASASIPLPSQDALLEEMRAQPSADLAARLFEEMEAVERVATTSNNLKGTYVRLLNIATRTVRAACTELVQRSESNRPSAPLEEENRRLRSRLKTMEDEVATLRKEMGELRERTLPPAPAAVTLAPSPPAGRTAKSARRTTRIYSSSEDEPPAAPKLREPPPPRHRPAPDKRPAPATSPPAAYDLDALIGKMGELVEKKLEAFRREILDGNPPPAARAEKGRNVRQGKAAANPARREVPKGAPPPPPLPRDPQPSPPTEEETWTTVVSRRGAKGRGQPPAKQPPAPKNRGAAKPAPPPAKQTYAAAAGKPAKQPTKRPAAPPPPAKAAATAGKGGEKSKGAGKPRPPAATPPPPQKKRAAVPARPPRTAAITLTTTPGGVSYADAMRRARTAINLKEVGISELRPKRGVTGSLILEIPGPEGRQKAAALAAKMEAALEGTGVRVAQPIKHADLRISGLDDSVTSEDVASSVADAGGCLVGEVRVGSIRRAPSGLGTIWVRCPLTAARKLAAAGKLVVGWVRAQVTYLPARPLQCHKCLQVGHVRSTCPSEEDRSGICYRCGVAGHKAGGCSAPLRCALCADQGKKADHRIGSQSCQCRRPPKKVAGKAPAAPKRSAQPAAAGKPATPTPQPSSATAVEVVTPAPVSMEVDMGAVAGPSTVVEERLEALTLRADPAVAGNDKEAPGLEEERGDPQCP